MKISKFIFASVIVLSSYFSYAQYSPAAGRPGSIAIYKDSSIIKMWADVCHVIRGYQNITNPSLGYASAGFEESATGKALENGVVSLGDGGYAILEFPKPITNGAGFDFVVFENGFDDYFLELAFVEVSSDGVNYERFPSSSNTNTAVQKNGFDTLDTRKIHNLAGKFRAGYGTPFDLDELKNIQSLNSNRITHVKILDVIGNIDSLYATYDSKGNKINDPWPTPFPQGGFDLDAVGGIHYEEQNSMDEMPATNSVIQIYPSILGKEQKLTLNIPDELKEKNIELSVFDVTGRRLEFNLIKNHGAGNIVTNFSRGIYILNLSINGRIIIRKKIIIL